MNRQQQQRIIYQQPTIVYQTQQPQYQQPQYQQQYQTQQPQYQPQYQPQQQQYQQPQYQQQYQPQPAVIVANRSAPANNSQPSAPPIGQYY